VRSVPALIVALLAACTTQPPPPPTEAEARAFLEVIVETALTEDLNALCDLGGGSCNEFIQQSGGSDVPLDPPTVVGTRRVEQETGGPRPRTGGYVLELCGRNAAGDLYYSELLVFRDFGGELRSIEPVYWMGITITDDDTTGRDPEQSSERCADVAG